MTPLGPGARTASRQDCPPTVLLINPNTSLQATEMMLAVARSAQTTDLIIRGATAIRGPAMIVDELALADAAEEVVRIALRDEGKASAIIVAAFGDPGVRRLRTLLPHPVVGIGEAAIREAAVCGRRFGIATTTPGLVQSIDTMVDALGFAHLFTGVRITATAPSVLIADADRQERELAQATRECIERDGAQAVIIGGGPLSNAAASLRRRFSNVIVEPVPAALRMVVQLAGRADSSNVEVGGRSDR